MFFPEDPDAGPEAGRATAAIVMRHTDEVRLQVPGTVAGFPLTHYRNKARLVAGGWVHVSGSGRAELFWPGRASSLILSGTNAVLLGDPDRDEALVRLREVTHARFVLTPEDRIELPGGAILRGDRERSNGPVVVERIGAELVRLRNESRGSCRVSFLADLFEIAPGEEVHLAILSGSGGSRPVEPRPDARTVDTGIVDFHVSGRVEWRESEGRIRITALEESEIAAQGATVRLAPGEELVLSPPRPAPRSASDAESSGEGERVFESPAEEGTTDGSPAPVDATFNP